MDSDTRKSIEYYLKPGSHLCDKHNTSDISMSISTRKKEHVPFFLVLMLMLMSLVEHVPFFLVLMLMLMSLVLCLSHKWELRLNVKLPTSLSLYPCTLLCEPDPKASFGRKLIESPLISRPQLR